MKRYEIWMAYFWPAVILLCVSPVFRKLFVDYWMAFWLAWIVPAFVLERIERTKSK